MAGVSSNRRDMKQEGSTMNAKSLIRLPPMMLAWQLFAGVAFAQQPTPTAIATARELVEIKGGTAMFDPVIISMIEQTKAALLQTNPQLAKDLSEVAVQLRNEFKLR